MAQPPKYTPQTSFVTYQAQQSWFPGQQLDVEFNDIETTTDAIEANLKLLQKDDGTLAEDIVDFSNLTDDFQTQLIAQGFVPPTPPATPSFPYVNVLTFGAVGDATANILTGAVTGTDNRAAIQAAIDYALQHKITQVFIPDGRYLCLGTLHLGYGDSFYTIELVGTTANYNAGNGSAGVELIFTAYDRQGLNIQGGRGVRVANIAFTHAGGNAWVFNNIEVPGTLPSAASSWCSPSFVGALNQHSPKAAITVDAFGGAQPADPYPNVIYPSWTGIVAQYNKNLTSGIVIEDCEFDGWPVGFGIGMNTDSQGDFLRFRGTNTIQSCAYGIVVCNTQSRNVSIADINYVFVNTLITNRNFGGGDGELGGPISNVSGGHAYQCFDINVDFSLGLTISHLYFEGQVRVGNFTSGGLSAAVSFVNCTFDTGEATHGQNPRAMVEVTGTININFDNCNNTNTQRLAQLVWGTGARTLSRNCLWYAGRKYDKSSSAGIIAAINYGGGVLMNGGATLPRDQNRIEGRNLVRYITPSVGEQTAVWGPDFLTPETVSPTQAIFREGVQSFRDTFGRKWDIINSRASNSQYAKSGLGSLAQTLDTLTFTVPNTLPNAQPNDFKPEVGDIWVDLPTGTLYATTVVVVASPYQITAVQMSNYSTASGTFASAVNVVASGGNFRLIKPKQLIPSKIFYGTVSSASGTVTSVSRGDGAGSDIDSYLSVGMLLHAAGVPDPEYGQPFAEGTYIGAITNGNPGSLTLVDASGGSVNGNANGTFPIMPVLVR